MKAKRKSKDARPTASPAPKRDTDGQLYAYRFTVLSIGLDVLTPLKVWRTISM